MHRLGWFVLVGVVGVAVADRKPTPQEELAMQLAGYHAEGGGDQPPSFAFSGHGLAVNAWPQRWSGGSFGEIYDTVSKPIVAYAAAPTVAWVAVDSRELLKCIDAQSWSGHGDAFPCPARNKIVDVAGESYAPGDVRHATGLFVKSSKGWVPHAYHIGVPHTAKEQAATLKKKAIKLEPIKRVLGGADDIVKMFETSIGSSKALAKTVSDRADVVLYGSELAERFVGGATVRSTLEKWNLAIKVTGLHAGIASKTVGFVAANIEATAGKGKPSPYRLLAVYEKTDAWKIVQLHFSFPNVFD